MENLTIDNTTWTVTNPKPGSWYSETETTVLRDGRCLETRWVGGEIEAVFIDGKLVFDGGETTPQTRLLDEIKSDSLLSIFEDVEAAYRLGLNPLPRLRDIMGPEVIVRFDGGSPRTQRGLIAPEDKTLLSIVLDDQYAVWWAFVPAGHAVDHRQRCSRHWCHGPNDFGYPPRQAATAPEPPAPGPRRVAPRE